MTALNIHHIFSEEADRISPSMEHEQVREKREAIAKRIAYLQAEKLRNADRRRAAEESIAKLRDQIEALNSSDDSHDAELHTLYDLDDMEADKERALERIMQRRGA